MTGIIDVTVHARVSKWSEPTRRGLYREQEKEGEKRGRREGGFFDGSFSRGSKVRLIMYAWLVRSFVRFLAWLTSVHIDRRDNNAKAFV